MIQKRIKPLKIFNTNQEIRVSVYLLWPELQTAGKIRHRIDAHR